MALIAHKFCSQRLAHEEPDLREQWSQFLATHGGYNPATGELEPLRLSSAEDVTSRELLFDSVTAAIEAGIIDSATWPKQLFSDDESLGVFFDVLEGYDESWRIGDRWFQAFYNLVTIGEEADCTTSAGLAGCLEGSANAL